MSRDCFESWFKSRKDYYVHSLRREDDGKYETSRVQLMWEAWQASREVALLAAADAAGIFPFRYCSINENIMHGFDDTGCGAEEWLK